MGSKAVFESNYHLQVFDREKWTYVQSSLLSNKLPILWISYTLGALGIR